MKTELKFEFDNIMHQTDLHQTFESVEKREPVFGSYIVARHSLHWFAEIPEDHQTVRHDHAADKKACKATRTQIALMKADVSLLMPPNSDRQLV
jgi:hypothetical protein